MPAQILFVSNEPLGENLIKAMFRREIKANKYQFTFAVNNREVLEKVKSNSNIQLAIVYMVPQHNFVDLLPDDHKIPGKELVSLFSQHHNSLMNEYYSLNISILEDLNNQYPHIKKVLLSVFGSNSLIKWGAINQGASSILTIPFEMEKLQQVVEESLSVRLE